MKNVKKEQGITLIALIITIIIMLILVAVTISVSLQGGLFEKTRIASQGTQVEADKEQLLDAVVAAIEPVTGKVNFEYLDEHLPKEFIGDSTENSGTYISEKENIFFVAENGTIINCELTAESTPYVGYYADIDADGKPDGIIYADLAIGNTGDGKWVSDYGIYSIEQTESGLKEYIVSKKKVSTKVDGKGFADNKMIIAKSGTVGIDRFYIMALEDINPGTRYSWFDDASISDFSTCTSLNFGTGKENTRKMVEKWNSGENGTQNAGMWHDDMWGVIQTEVSKGWFIPSRAEWSAFAEELGGISKTNTNPNYYENLGFRDSYGSSSMSSPNDAYFAGFSSEYVYSCHTSYSAFIRLSATF